MELKRDLFIKLEKLKNNDLYNNNYIICNDNNIIHRFYAKNDVEAIKKYNLFLILKEYNTDLDINDLKNIITEAKKQKINIIYNYDILGFLSDFKVNKKSITCTDQVKKVVFKNNSKYIFYKNAIDTI